LAPFCHLPEFRQAVLGEERLIPRVGKITEAQLEEIAKIKMPDLNCFDVEAAIRSVKGTARSMGVDVV
jgi:ribosomal protein L11